MKNRNTIYVLNNNGTTEDSSIMFFNVSAAQCESLMLSRPQDS